MKIKERIIQLQKNIKTDRWIDVCYNNAEHHAENIGFYLKDADEFLDSPVLERELWGESRGNVRGIRHIRLGFGEVEDE